MAIRNLIAGGIDFVEGERLDIDDLNDTFDSIYNLINEIT